MKLFLHSFGKLSASNDNGMQNETSNEPNDELIWEEDSSEISAPSSDTPSASSSHTSSGSSPFPKRQFAKMMQLLDCCSLDYSSLRFLPSVLAASVLYRCFPQGT
jgi:hypothetical protein